ncbi:hypothetical protein PRNP1_009257 [Phytophthora ramorum]
MAKATPSEKRAEERLIQDLRDFQRSNPANKRCFDCNEMMPQYVCLDFNTFVCTACSGIHREFAHRVKSISMSKFTESEVKNLVNHGGNEAAQKYWRSRHDPSFRPNGGSDGERTRNFIRLTYIDRKWVYESPRHAKEDEPERTSSKSSRSKKEKKADSDDDFFSSKPAKKSSGTDEQFGDFSNFEGSARTAAQSFGDFGDFDSPAPAKKAVDGFADFGDFEGSAANSRTTNAVPKEASKPPPPAPKFGSFKIAPPPGSNFSSSSAIAMPATNDLMGLSPTKETDDPFGFDTPAQAREPQLTPEATSPFDAFNASTPTSRAGSRSNSAASLDPFSNMVAPTPPAPAPAKQNVSPFDAFGSPAASTPSAFDAFASPSPASTAGSNVFDAFGGGGDAFGDFTGSNSSSRTNSANPPVVDLFAITTEKPTPAAAADPFTAFDGMQSSGAATAVGTAPTSDFGSIAFPGGNGASQQQAASVDPFAFGSGASNTGFPAAQQQGSGATNQQFGGFPSAPGGFSQLHQPQNAFNGQMQQPMQPIHPGQPQQTQQQQWYGQPQGFPGQQQPMHSGQQYPGQLPPRPVGGAAPPAPISVKTPASINDPFASLNIGSTFGFSDSSSTAARTGSGGAASSAPFPPTNRPDASNSFGSAPFAYGQPPARSSSSFTHPPPNNATFADPNAFGDFTSAPTQTPASPANPFDLF